MAWAKTIQSPFIFFGFFFKIIILFIVYFGYRTARLHDVKFVNLLPRNEEERKRSQTSWIATPIYLTQGSVAQNVISGDNNNKHSYLTSLPIVKQQNFFFRLIYYFIFHESRSIVFRRLNKAL